MELYIEKAFLDKFNGELNKTINSKGKTVLASILKTYGDLKWFTDYEIDTAEKLEQFNIVFSEIISQIFPPIPLLSSTKQHFFKYSRCEQTLIFTMHEEDWFDEAEKKGALCFCYENFERKLESIISICENLKIDLSEPFLGWDYFKELKSIPKNKIIINDGYLFAQNGGNRPLYENVIPLLKNVLNPNAEMKVEIYTNYLKIKPPSLPIDIERIKSNLNNVFKADYTLSFAYIQGYNHDRILYSNFFLMECGVGFNFNTKYKSNSTIVVSSIFDKFNYKRMKNHIVELEERKAKSPIN